MSYSSFGSDDKLEYELKKLDFTTYCFKITLHVFKFTWNQKNK